MAPRRDLRRGHLADIAQRYLHKGSKVYLEGQLQTRKWTDQSGQERYTTEVAIQRFRGELTLLDSRADGGGGDGGGGRDYGGGEPAGAPPAAADSAASDLDDDIPF